MPVPRHPRLTQLPANPWPAASHVHGCSAMVAETDLRGHLCCCVLLEDRRMPSSAGNSGRCICKERPRRAADTIAEQLSPAAILLLADIEHINSLEGCS